VAAAENEKETGQRGGGKICDFRGAKGQENAKFQARKEIEGEIASQGRIKVVSN